MYTVITYLFTMTVYFAHDISKFSEKARQYGISNSYCTGNFMYNLLNNSFVLQTIECQMLLSSNNINFDIISRLIYST